MEAERPAARPISDPQLLKLHLTGFADLRGGRSVRWRVGEVEGQRSRLTLRCNVVTVQSQVVRKVSAKEEEEEEKEWGCVQKGGFS